MNSLRHWCSENDIGWPEALGFLLFVGVAAGVLVAMILITREALMLHGVQP